MKKTTLFSLALCTTLFSCEKDDGALKLQRLTTGTWKWTGYMTDWNKDGGFEENTFVMLDDCYKDDIYTFLPDGNQTIDDGPSICDSPLASISTWSFEDDEDDLQIGWTKYTIEELSATTLKLKARVSHNIIYTINIRYTYTKL